MTGFTKLFQDIVTSTIWREPDTTRIVWVTMLALADKDGFVSSSVPGLAAMANVAMPKTIEALATLMSPDKWSRSKEYEGRRIAEVDGGWKILNHAKYRDKLSAEERRRYLAEKQAEYRRKKQMGKPLKGEVEFEKLAENGATDAELDEHVTKSLPKKMREARVEGGQ